MEARASSSDDTQRVVAPILIGNTLSWALWGLITAQVLAHAATRNARLRNRTSRHGKNASAASSSADSSALARVGFGLRSRGGRRMEPNSATGPDSGVSGFSGKVRKLKGHWAAAANEGADDAFARADVNPWTIAFTPQDDGAVGAYPRLPPPAPASATGVRGRLSHVISFYHHGHRQAQNSMGTTTQTGTTTGASNSPLSPHPFVRPAPYIHTYPPATPSPRDELDSELKYHENTSDRRAVSGLSSLLLALLYALVCLQAIFGTIQFWHAVVPHSPGDPTLTNWAVVAAVDCVAPIAFFTTVLYFVHSFFYSCPLFQSSPSRESRTSNRTSSVIPTPNDNGPSKMVTDLLADVEPGTGVGASQKPKLRPLRLSLLSGKVNIGEARVETVRSGNGPALLSGLSLRGLGRTSRIATLGLVVLIATLVSVCGLIDSSRSFSAHAPLGSPPRTDAIALIWLAGSFALDVVLCVTLVVELALAGVLAQPERSEGTLLAQWFQPIRVVLCVLGPGGGLLLIDALLALVFALVWGTGNKPNSTIPLVPLVIMPALYAGTVFLHVAFMGILPSAAPSTVSRRRFDSWPLGLSSKTGDSRYGAKTELKEKGKRDEAAYAEAIELSLRASGRDQGGTAGTYTTTSDSHQPRTNGSSNRVGSNMVTGGSGSASQTNMNSAIGSQTKGVVDVGDEDGADRRASIMSGPSEAAVSLELPVFRPGRVRAHAYAPYGPWPYPGVNGDSSSLWEDDEWDNDGGYGEGSDEDYVSESEIGSVWGDEVFRLGYDADGVKREAFGEEGRQAGMWGYGFAGAMNQDVNIGQGEAGPSQGLSASRGGTNAIASGSGTNNNNNVNAVAGPSSTSRRWQPQGPRDKQSRAYTAIDVYATMPRDGGAPFITNANEDDLAYAGEDDDRVSMLSGASALGRGGAGVGVGGNGNDTRPRSRSRSISTSARRPRHRASAMAALIARRRTLPAQPRNSTSSMSSMPLSKASPRLPQNGNNNNNMSVPGSPAGSVLVIGRGRNGDASAEYGYGRRRSEGGYMVSSGGGVPYSGYSGYFPSGAPTREPSIAAGASVAATRASTGSAWSGWSAHVYPRPLVLPELDTDLSGLELDQETGEVRDLRRLRGGAAGEQDDDEGEDGEAVGNGGGGGESMLGINTNGDVDAARTGTNLTTSAGTGTNSNTNSGTGTYHTAYSPTSGQGTENDSELPESVLGQGEPRRRWRVHPLKRMVEMGRLKR